MVREGRIWTEVEEGGGRRKTWSSGGRFASRLSSQMTSLWNGLERVWLTPRCDRLVSLSDKRHIWVLNNDLCGASSVESWSSIRHRGPRTRPQWWKRHILRYWLTLLYPTLYTFDDVIHRAMDPASVIIKKTVPADVNEVSDCIGWPTLYVWHWILDTGCVQWCCVQVSLFLFLLGIDLTPSHPHLL